MLLKNAFDPMDDLFVAQFARPAHLEEVNLRALSPFQRVLLVIDGTVTKFIEAYTMEPVDVVHLGDAVQTLAQEHRWLDAPAGTPVTARHVLLRGRYGRTCYAYAASLIVPDRLSPEFRAALDRDGGGLGRALVSSRMENYREVLWYGRERAADLPEPIRDLADETFISRTYRIIAGGRPVMLISERFPSRVDARPALD
jgi:chorismate-pyruvate lyase